MSLTECLGVISRNIALCLALPPLIWGREKARKRLESSGLAGAGWLGKDIQRVSVAYEELRVMHISFTRLARLTFLTEEIHGRDD
jgi:hypothetical protein